MTRDLACALLVATIFGSLVHQSVLAETTSVLAMVQQTKSHARQGDHAMAAQILDQAKMMAPNSEDVLGDFAKNSLAAGDPVGAINTLEPLMRIHPKVAEYPYLLGVALLQVKEYQPSANALRRSRSSDNRPLSASSRHPSPVRGPSRAASGPSRVTLMSSTSAGHPSCSAPDVASGWVRHRSSCWS